MIIINLNELENLIQYYKDGKLSHAYLISTNNTEKCMKVLLNVIKNIFCVSYEDNCNKCSLCHLIDINNFPSLKIIEPDGNFIKKEQIIELKNAFSKDSQYASESIYVIKNAEKMNKESANTILKFLEEPSGNVIGFFITTRKDNIMPTIQSRTQMIEVNFENDLFDSLGLTEEKYFEYMDVTKKYLEELENNKTDLILINKKYLDNFEKDDIKNILKIILELYKNSFRKKCRSEKIIDFDYLNQYTNSNLLKKINLIIKILEELNYNVNVSLIMDKFVLEMEQINNEGIWSSF